VVNYLRGQPNLLPSASVFTTYRHAEPPTDPLHNAQASDLRIRLGLSSAVGEIMREHGLTRDEARNRVEENLSETREMTPLVLGEKEV